MMRLLRALAYLVLAFALLGVAVAPARAAAFALTGVSERHLDRDHPSPGVQAEHAAHEHGTPASEHPAHKRDLCQTACCFVPSQLPPRVAGPSTALSFRAVRYPDEARLALGRADAPEPGIPKSVA